MAVVALYHEICPEKGGDINANSSATDQFLTHFNTRNSPRGEIKQRERHGGGVIFGQRDTFICSTTKKAGKHKKTFLFGLD